MITPINSAVPRICAAYTGCLNCHAAMNVAVTGSASSAIVDNEAGVRDNAR